jgi:predicted alternative tryptophan synthase beta-subunit
VIVLKFKTGAGQWGSVMAFATCLLDMECEVGVRLKKCG